MDCPGNHPETSVRALIDYDCQNRTSFSGSWNMKAIRFYRYGKPDVLRYETAPRPVLQPNEVLVELRAAAVNPKDCLIRKGKFRLLTGWRFPKTLGNDLAGEVVDLGGGFTGSLSLGDQIFGMSNKLVGATYAELVAVRAEEIALAPATISLEEAAGLPLVAQTALQALRDLGRIESGQRVCINGGSGGLGTVAIQLARHFGAHVTAVCSAKNEELCRQLGADEVVAYDERELLDSGARFDIFFDVFGNRPFTKAKRVLNTPSHFVSAVPSPGNYWQAARSRWSKQRAHVVVVRSRTKDLQTLATLVQDGALRPVVDRSYPLSEAAEAHSYVQTKRARGKVLLTPR